MSNNQSNFLGSQAGDALVDSIGALRDANISRSAGGSGCNEQIINGSPTKLENSGNV